jgi:ABC-type antimicrobial peptide transport system permease subunit
VLRAVGFTPRQVLAGLIGSQAALAALAAAVGIPLGLAMFGALYQLAGGEGRVLAMPPAWRLLIVPPATVAAVALVALIPARLAAAVGITDALRNG